MPMKKPFLALVLTVAIALAVYLELRLEIRRLSSVNEGLVTRVAELERTTSQTSAGVLKNPVFKGEAKFIDAGGNVRIAISADSGRILINKNEGTPWGEFSPDQDSFAFYNKSQEMALAFSSHNNGLGEFRVASSLAVGPLHMGPKLGGLILLTANEVGSSVQVDTPGGAGVHLGSPDGASASVVLNQDFSKDKSLPSLLLSVDSKSAGVGVFPANFKTNGRYVHMSSDGEGSRLGVMKFDSVVAGVGAGDEAMSATITISDGKAESPTGLFFTPGGFQMSLNGVGTSSLLHQGTGDVLNIKNNSGEDRVVVGTNQQSGADFGMVFVSGANLNTEGLVPTKPNQ